jgi:sugar lactone lactonase YvrE
VSANSLLLPNGLALDGSGNLYVADVGDSRVLEYDTPLSSGTTADRVFGQPGFTARATNNGGLNANGLANPAGLALDAAGNLYVADINNNRVLEYNAPLSSSQAAERVFGQTDFSHNDANHGGLGAGSLDAPEALALDGWGNLYVSDHGNNRVLEYARPLAAAADHSADRIFGQPNATSNTANNGGVSATSLDRPEGVAVDACGDLYVADFGNNRVLEYDWALLKLELPLVVR